jgi:hypothetical protein
LNFADCLRPIEEFAFRRQSVFESLAIPFLKARPMIYHLSKRQLKELANAKCLRIALPYPDQGIPGAHVHHDGTLDPPDAGQEPLVAWASQVLDLASFESQADITWAEIATVAVDPTAHGSGSLGALLGQISTIRVPWMVRILCVVVELAARRQPRAPYPTQWPAYVEIEGRRFPAAV